MQMLGKKYFRKSKSPISGNMLQTRILDLPLDIAQIFPRYQNIYQQKFETSCAQFSNNQQHVATVVQQFSNIK